jgi:hypothetical protein
MNQMATILEFMYKGEVSLNPKEVEDFIATARHLSICGLPKYGEPEAQPISRGLQSPGNHNFSVGPPSRMRRSTELCLEDLPVEILLKILSYLSTTNLVWNVVLVCKRFFGLSNDAHIVVRLHYHVVKSYIKIRAAVEFLKKAVNLEELHHIRIDRISRSIMKNSYENGGMKVTDVECLDRSIKLKQFIRAHKSNYIISKFQGLITGSEDNKIRQEYFEITEKEDICHSAQTTLNIITDYNRELHKDISIENHEVQSNRMLRQIGTRTLTSNTSVKLKIRIKF